VGLVIITHKITHISAEVYKTAILEFSMHRAFHTKEDMSFAAPMIGLIAGRILNPSYADVIDHLRLPVSHPGFSFVLFFRNRRPVKCLKRKDAIFIKRL
jgi:hypothetical protein